MGRLWNVLGLALPMWGAFEILCIIGSRDADWGITLSVKKRCAVIGLCAIQAADIARHCDAAPYAARCLLGVLLGCLLTACVMDLKECAVYRFVWRAAGGAAGLLLLLRAVYAVQTQGWETGIDAGGLLLYIAIQHIIFGRMYGRADCFAFSVCAVAQTAMGGNVRDHVIHLAMAFSGLAVLQCLRGNIASDGNLKTPVPFLPYIAASFWLWVDFMAGKWYIYS